MPDPRDVVVDIESFLNSEEGLPASKLAEMAGAYAPMCQEANRRLKRCSEYLRRGLRGEAIYHAEMPPKLLDMVAALDFPRAADWAAVCTENHLEAAPPLLMDIAEALNIAYDAEAPVRDLQERLRWLSLERAPIAERLAVLRSLGEIDSTSATLDEDIKTFESARHDEIAKEVKEMLGAKDLESLFRLSHEVSGSPWRQQPPAALREAVARVTRRVQVKAAEAAIGALLPKLHTAYAAMSYEESRDHLRELDDVLAVNSIRLSDETANQIQPIVNWVNDIEREEQLAQNFRDACSALRSDLSDTVSLAHLHRRYQEARSFDQPIPEDLEHDYRSRAVELELAQKRRGRAIAASAIVALLIVGGAVTFFVHRGMLTRSRQEWVERITKTINQDRPEEGKRIWEELIAGEDRDFASHPDLKRVKTALDKALRQVAESKEIYLAAMTEATKLIAANDYRSPGIDKVIERAGKHARTDAEKHDLQVLKDKVSEARNTAQAERNDKFREAIDAISKQALTIPSLINKSRRDDPAYEANIREADRITKDLLKEVDRLNRRLGITVDTRRLTESPERELRSYKKAIDEILDDLEAHKQEWQDITRVAKTGLTPLSLANGLKEYAKTNPGSAKAKQFDVAAKQASLWDSVYQWSVLIGGRDEFAPRNPEDADRRAKAVIVDYLGEHGHSPMKSIAVAYGDYLQTAASAPKSGKIWESEFAAKTLQSPVMQLLSFKGPTGKRYYVEKRKDWNLPSLGGFSAYVVKTRDFTKQEGKEKISFRGAEESDLKAPLDSSPQLKLAVTLVAMVARRKFKDMETLGLDIAETIAQSQDVDPILRAMLLTQVVSMSQQTLWGIDEELTGIERMLESLNVGQLSWMNPDDLTANANRPHIAEVLQSVSFPEVRKILLQERRELFRRLEESRYMPTGMAVRRNGVWEVLPNASIPNGSALWIVLPTSDSSSQLRQVGICKDGTIQIDPATFVGVSEGTMVFKHSGNAD